MYWILAFDHRNSFRTGFFGLTGDATEDDHAKARWAKGIVFDGILRAIADGIPSGQPAVLVDEEYGADVIHRAQSAGVPTVVPVEVSGRREVAFEHGDDGFGTAIDRIDPAFAKVLVRYHPADHEEMRAAQQKRLLALQGHGRPWMLELLVPDTTESERPAATVAVVEELVAAGLAPQLWKLEGMPSSSAYAAVAAACGADGLPGSPQCLVLGRGADAAAVDRWLSLAAPVPGFGGFAVGRTLWWEPLRGAVDGVLSPGDAAAVIAANYRRLINVYLDAAASSDVAVS